MTTTGAMPSLFFAFAMVSVGTTFAAQKISAGADPFEQTEAPPKTATPPAPTKPTTTIPAKIASDPAPHLPAKELAAFMKPFEGSWKCETQFAVGALWPGSQPLAAKTDINIRKEFDGFSWHGEFKLARTAATPATTGIFQIGYASSTKQATYLSYDSIGSSMMGTGTFAGASVTFQEEGFMKGARVKVRETLAKQGPRKLYHKVEIDQGKGYQLLGEDTCAK